MNKVYTTEKMSKATTSGRLLYLLSIMLTLGCSQKLKTASAPVDREDWWLWTASWHPNQNQFVVGGTQDTLRLFSTTNHRLLKNYPIEGTITATQWHPSHNKLAIAMQGGQSKTSIWDLASNERIELDSINDFGARAIGWNSKGTLLAVGDYDGFLVIFDEAGKMIKKVSTDQKSIIGLDWHPSKDVILAVGDRITIYDLNTGFLHQVEDRKEEVLMLCAEWHPSGELFVTGDYGDFDYHYPPLLQFWTPEGTKITSIERSQAEYRSLKWSEDGALLATASESIRLWDKSGHLVSEKPCPHLLWGIDWNRAGTKLVTTDEKGSIVLWDKDLNILRSITY